MKAPLRLTLLTLVLAALSARASDVDIVARQLPPLVPNPRPENPNPRPDPQLPASSSTPSTPLNQPTPITPAPTTPPPVAPPTNPTTPPSTPPLTSPPATTPLTTPAATTPPPTPVVTPSVSTDNQGVETTITNTITPSVSSATPSSTSAPTTSKDNSDKGISTGTIIGISVAGGVALLVVVAFLIWKLTRNRSFNDFDDGEAIKWPELNSHNKDQYALPTNNTGRSGFETSGDLSRAPSLTSHGNSVGATVPSAYPAPYSMTAASASDVYGADPYHVPPLPHQNPNIPPSYHDDPNAAAPGAYYDPYSGPVPHTIHDPDGPPSATLAGPAGHWGPPRGEAIPMTQMSQRSRSPGPGMAYDTDRGSPAPGGMGRRSPGPAMAYEMGRGSPAPASNPAYGSDPYNRSTGPYDTYGGR